MVNLYKCSLLTNKREICKYPLNDKNKKIQNVHKIVQLNFTLFNSFWLRHCCWDMSEKEAHKKGNINFPKQIM